jgi:hypothetical protein
MSPSQGFLSDHFHQGFAADHLHMCLMSCVVQELATWLDSAVGNPDAVAAVIGLASAVVDNVPLVAATMGGWGVMEAGGYML